MVEPLSRHCQWCCNSSYMHEYGQASVDLTVCARAVSLDSPTLPGTNGEPDTAVREGVVAGHQDAACHTCTSSMPGAHIEECRAGPAAHQASSTLHSCDPARPTSLIAALVLEPCQRRRCGRGRTSSAASARLRSVLLPKGARRLAGRPRRARLASCGPTVAKTDDLCDPRQASLHRSRRYTTGYSPARPCPHLADPQSFADHRCGVTSSDPNAPHWIALSLLGAPQPPPGTSWPSLERVADLAHR